MGWSPKMTPATQIVADWTGHLTAGYGTADDLRCAAMECQELGIARKDFVAACVEAGYKEATASRCWSFVAAQEK